MSMLKPIVVVLGCTGTGKSKLAIELAKQFNGEIISSDSMQVYKGLDIITNKVLCEEQNDVVHHCLDFIDPLTRYTVVDFQKKALPIIHSLLKETKTPIIVGGTNYYIESLLWDVLIKSKSTDEQLLFEIDKKNRTNPTEINKTILNAQELFKQTITQDSLDFATNEILHKCLKEIDPSMANAVHFNDRRKVVRSLQVYQQIGIKHSDLLAEQQNKTGGSSLGGPLRFQNIIMFWIQCEKEVLKKRLDDRVDDMLKLGLISELLDFHENYNKKRNFSETPKYTEGIFQSIGFKEFHNYLILSEKERKDEVGEKLFKQGIENMKLATKQYARKQEKWIVNRFLRKPDRQVPPVYALQATNLDQWEKNVYIQAVEILSNFIENKKPVHEPLQRMESLCDSPETNYCNICERTFFGKRTWEIHIKSKKHQKMKSRQKKLCTTEDQ